MFGVKTSNSLSCLSSQLNSAKSQGVKDSKELLTLKESYGRGALIVVNLSLAQHPK
jgi:hypothetical protein